MKVLPCKIPEKNPGASALSNGPFQVQGLEEGLSSRQKPPLALLPAPEGHLHPHRPPVPAGPGTPLHCPGFWVLPLHPASMAWREGQGCLAGDLSRDPLKGSQGTSALTPDLEALGFPQVPGRSRHHCPRKGFGAQTGASRGLGVGSGLCISGLSVGAGGLSPRDLSFLPLQGDVG